MTLTALGTNQIAGGRNDSVTTLPITDSTTLTAGDFLELSSGKLIKSVTDLSEVLIGVAASTITSGVYSTSGQQDYMGAIAEGLIICRGLVEGSGGTYTSALAVGTKVSFHYDATTGYGQFVVASDSSPIGTVVYSSVASSGDTTDQWDYVLVQLDFERNTGGGGGDLPSVFRKTITYEAAYKSQYRAATQYIGSSGANVLDIYGPTTNMVATTAMNVTTPSLGITTSTSFGIYAPDIRLGISSAIYMKIAQTASTGVMAVTFVGGSGVTYTLTAPTITFVASTSISLDGDTTVNAAHTFGTGTGAVSLNGDTTVAATKTLYIRDASQSIASSADNNMEITSPTLGLVASTKINLDGATDLSGALVLDTAATTGITFSGATYTTGISMPGGISYNPIHIGVKENLADNGLILVGVTDDTGGVMIFCDDGGDALGSVTSPIWTRYLITENQGAGGPTATGMFAQIKNLAATFATGSYTALKAYFQCGGATILDGSNTEMSIINAGITYEGDVTVTDGTLSGIDINVDDNTHTIGTSSGLIIRKVSASTLGWTYGVNITDGGAVTGISIGTCTTAINIGTGSTRGLLLGAPNQGTGSTGMTLLTDNTTWLTGATVGIYFDDGDTALTAWGEGFTVGTNILADSTGQAQTGWPYNTFFYTVIDADIDANAANHWANCMMNMAVSSTKTLAGFDNNGVSTLHLSFDVNGIISAETTVANLSFGGNSPGTINGTWVCMDVRDTTGDFTALLKVNANATGCYTEAYTGNGAFVPNSKGTFTQTGQLRVIVNGATVYIPYGTVAN